VRRPSLRATILLALTALLALALAACGGGEDSSGGEDPVPAPDASAFPAAGASLNALTSEVTPTDQYVVSPAGQIFNQGRQRFSFGVFTVDGEQVTDADIAIYVAPGPDGKPQGPFPARVENLETEPAFTAQTTSQDPDAAKAVYVTDVTFDQPGEWRIVAAIQQDGEMLGSLLPSINVRAEDPVPEVGEKAPVVHTPTADDVGDIGEIDTRVPPSSMHDTDLADVIGKKPVVLLFATPALCTSRVCGPVVDVAEQVKRDVGDEAAFIYQEIYVNNTPPNVRPQVAAYNLRTEPWLFVIDTEGKVSTRIEGAFSVAELQDAVDRVTQ
jgi:hypothetical protein